MQSEELNTNFGAENVRLSLIFYPKIVHCNTKVFIQTVLPPRLGARFPFLIPPVTAVVISFIVPELVEFNIFGFVGSPLFCTCSLTLPAILVIWVVNNVFISVIGVFYIEVILTGSCFRTQSFHRH